MSETAAIDIERPAPRGWPLRYWLTALAAATLLLLALLIVVMAVVAGSHFDQLEREEAQIETQVARRALQRIADTKRAAAAEYGTWDEMLRYVRDPNSQEAADWARTNVIDWHRDQYGDRALAVWNSERQLVLGWATAGYSNVIEEIADELTFSMLDHDRRIGGFLRTSQGIVVVGAAVVTRSDDLAAREPARGYLLAVRPLDRGTIEDLRQTLGKRVSIERIDADQLLPFEPDYVVRGREREIIVPLRDLRGQTIARLTLTEPRDALLAIRGSFHTTLALAAGMIVALIGLLWLATRRLVVRPLAALEESLARMHSNRASEPIRVAPPSREWGLFIDRFNSTVEALRSSEARYRVLFDQAADAIFLLERQSGRVLAANPAAQALTGLAHDELLGAVLLDHLVPEEDEIEFRGTFRAIRTDRSRRTIAATSTEITLDGVPCVLVSMRDQTEREQMQRALREIQRLEGIAVLAGGVAHDFNNLLAVIAGNAGLAGRETDPARRAHRLANVERAAARASDLTRQLLAYAGRGQFVHARVELGKLASEMAELLRTTVGSHAELELELAADLPEVDGDPGQLQQIIMNLITNAAEALEGRAGTVRVHTSLLNLDGVRASQLGIERGDYVCIEVSDDGVGMTPQVQARVFEPFFTTKFTGRGLGLAAVYGIARAHGGHVEIVASAPGAGTRIRVLLPLAAAATAGAALAS